MNIYLSLPEVPDLEIASLNFNDIGVQQLKANIFHLKSQLLLAKSIIQAKDAAIESLSFTNYQQKLLLDSNDKKAANEETALNGLIKINEYKSKGLSFNLPELFRRIKRKLK